MNTAHPLFKPAILAASLCMVLFIAASLTRPLFPVDETRYLTVAWEMHQSGNWILPTLNHEAYHHKPPVLFWLINLVWSIFGVSQEAAMAVPYLAAFAFLMLAARLATRLFPDDNKAPLLATAFLAGGLPFVIYSNLIMFDLLLGVFAILGLTAVWDYMTTRNKKHLIWLALAIGLGVLTKGPVILLHVGTVILLAKFWLPTSDKPLKQTVLPIALTVLAGALIALSWAIPAAIEGGKAFADKIFWGQTAGRMVKAFDHARPVYWYLTFVPLFLLPWLASPTMWKGTKSLFGKTVDPHKKSVKRFLLAWAAPVFVAFSFISGKQVHYLVPLLPAIALTLTAALLAIKPALEERLGKADIWAPLGIVTLLTLIPVIMHQGAVNIEKFMGGHYSLKDPFSQTNMIPPLVVAAIIIALGVAAKRETMRSILTVTISMALMMASFQFAAKSGFFTEYDLTPMARELQKYPDRPIAFMNNYQGEYGFLARMDRPLAQITQGQLPAWLKENPNGLAIFRTKRPKDFEKYNVVFTMPYRLTTTYALVETHK